MGIQIIDRRERKQGVVSALETPRGKQKKTKNKHEKLKLLAKEFVLRGGEEEGKGAHKRQVFVLAEQQRDGAGVLPGLAQAKECGSDHAHVKPPHSVCPTNTIMLKT